MAKTMIAARPGALTEILKAKNLTMVEVAQAWQFSRGTLRAIDQGRPVKSDTLAKAAKSLLVPHDHLLPPQAVATDVRVDGVAGAGAPSPMNPSAEGSRTERHLTGTGLLVKAVGPDAIDLELLWTSRITWTVDVKTPREAHPLVSQLGAALAVVATPHRRPDEEWGSLEHQLQEIAAWDEVKRLMTRLEEHGFHLLIGTYLRWTCEEYRHPYEEYVTGYGYQSHLTAHLYVAPKTVKSCRIYVNEGPKPPQFSDRRGPSTYVNDRKLPREPVEPPANDDRSAVLNDDIPF